MKVTACLITWKRQDNLPEIIKSLTRWDFINQIMILDNSKGENIISYGRYIQALKAENNIIYTQDDDCLVNNLGDVYAKFVLDPTTICHSGTLDYEKDIPNNIHAGAQMALAGWGGFFSKGWVKVLDKYIDKFGKDYCFYRETDRIFSLLLNKHHNFVLGDIIHLPGWENSHALCQQKDHLHYKKLAVERALSLI